MENCIALTDVFMFGLFVAVLMYFISPLLVSCKRSKGRKEAESVNYTVEDKWRYYDAIAEAGLSPELKLELESLVAMIFSAGARDYFDKVFTHPHNGEYDPSLISKLNLEEAKMLKTIASTCLRVNGRANWWTLSQR